ncbi:MAG: TY-Chap domain-containing protein [Actinomycetota bacterium]
MEYASGEAHMAGVDVMWPLRQDQLRPEAVPPASARAVRVDAEDGELFAEPGTRTGWGQVVGLIAEEIRWLKDGDFVMIEYGESTDDAIAPYAQVALDEEGYWCEIVSNDYLPGDTWPLHGDVLKEAGWNAPDAHCPNWHSLRTGSQTTAVAVLAGLREGRGCADVRLLSWHTGMMPPSV